MSRARLARDRVAEAAATLPTSPLRDEIPATPESPPTENNTEATAMFCTSLRRRASFASITARLTGSENLGLRGTLHRRPYVSTDGLTATAESQLGTHDLALPVTTSIDPRTGSTVASRTLRVLLFSPSSVSDEKLSETVERIRRFASLTGGHDLAIAFLLQSAPSAGFVSAKDLKENAVTPQAPDDDGIVAYSKLQATLTDHAEIPCVPVLLLAKLESLPEVLMKHVGYLSRPKQRASPPTTPFALLQLCTASPPMSQHTAFILSDLFADLRELAAVCTAVSSAPNSSSPSVRAAGLSSQPYSTQGGGMETGLQYSEGIALGKLKQLRDLVGEQECADIVDFWKEEWTID